MASAYGSHEQSRQLVLTTRRTVHKLDYMQSSHPVVLSLDNEERSRLELAARVQGLSVEQLLRAAVGLPRERQSAAAPASPASARRSDQAR